MRTLHGRTAGATLAAVLAAAALAGCGSDGGGAAGDGASGSASSSPSGSPSASNTEIPKPKVVDGRIEATDGSFTVAVPKGWTSPERGVPAPFVVALQDQQDKASQLVASTYPQKGDAEETARSTAAGLTQQKAVCDEATVDGHALIDCHYDYQGQQVRKMLFPVERGEGSVLVLFQTLAETRQAGYAKATPFFDSWTWDDGTKF